METNPTTKKQSRWALFSKYLLIFLLISFGGWAWETLYFLVSEHRLLDRGFLTTPICPIYGFAILLVYFLIGTPKEGRGLLRKVKSKKALIPLYFLMAMLIPTLLELLVGWVFDYFFHTHLWTYEGNWMNFRGYISPSITLFWGVCLTLAMRFLFPHLKNLFMRVPDRAASVLGVILIVLLSTDTVLCFASEIRDALAASPVQALFL